MAARLNVACGLAVLAVCAANFIQVPEANAQDSDCTTCHTDMPESSPAHPELVCIDCHQSVTDGHERADIDASANDSVCADCHRRAGRELGRSIHDGQASCTGCHGDPHVIHELADLDSAVSPVNQISNCGACHDGQSTLIEDYLTSEHGRALLLSGLTDAPSCSDCHGDHDILGMADERASTSHANVPETCGSCHGILLETWQSESAHGLVWQQHEEGPVCTSCHASHGTADPTIPATRLASADICGDCHVDYLFTFRDSFHGKANDLGFVSGATCADCHTPHRNLPADDPRSSVHASNLADTCSRCHESVTASFISFDPHNDPADPEDNFAVYIVWLFMTGLLIAVFGFFGIHDLLWLQRSVVGVIRREFDEEASVSDQYIRRFSRLDIRMHVVIIVTFLLLAMTGLPLKFHAAGWAREMIDLLGGVDTARFIHRLAAVGTFGYALFHLGHLFVRAVIRSERGLFWGSNSMVPQPKDVADLFANFLYFLYLRPKPAGDRWTYFEKFDYLAVFWGIMIIGVSGLMLWLPTWFTSFLPGWSLNAAYVIHSDEALLATGFIFVFHFFHTHLKPESFPMDVAIFTGKVPLSRFRAERPLEYQRLVENDELDQYLVDAPTVTERRRAYFWGSAFLTLGILMAIGILWALLVH